MQRTTPLLRLFIFCIFIFLYAGGNAVAANADSLKKILHKHPKNDTAKATLLLQICDDYFFDNPDSLELYARRALKQAQQINNQYAQGKAIAYMGEVYYLRSKPDSALATYNKALAISRSIKSGELEAFIMNNMGSVHLRNRDYKQSLNYYDSVIVITKRIKDKNLQAAAISNTASIFYTQGSYATALKKYLEGLELYEELNNKQAIETALLNIINVHYRLGEYDKAKKYMTRAMGMAEQSGSKWSIISCNTTLAMIHNAQGNYDSALACLNRAMKLAENLNNTYLINLLKGNLAEAYMKKGELQKAYDMYAATLPVSEQLGDTEGIAIAKAGMGEILTKQGNTSLGITYMKEALKMMQQADMKEQAKNIAEALANTMERTGNYKEALYYTKIKNDYRDSLVKDDALKAGRAMEYDYELGKKEAQIALLEKDKAIEEGKIINNRIILFSALAAAFLAIIIAILLFRNMMNTKRRNAVIMEQKHEMELQAQKLEQLNDFKDTTFSVLSHDLRSPINALTGTMSLLDEGMITPEEFKLYKEELNNKLQSVTLLLDNLLQWAKSQMKGEHTLDIEKLNVRRKTLGSFAVLKDAAKQKNITLATNTPEDLYVLADRNQLEMVMRNLVSNAIKFTPENGTVSVKALAGVNNVAISITDNGVGMTTEQVTQLFNGSPNASTYGTGGEKGTGIGLQLSHNFIVNNKGSITVESQPGKGTTFTVILPSA